MAHAAETSKHSELLLILQCNTPEDQEFLLNLKTLWQQCKHAEPLVSRLKECFSAPGCNPYVRCLFLMYNSSDYTSPRFKSLCGSVLTVFVEWQKGNDHSSWLTEEAQALALEVAVGLRNVHLQEKAAKAFRLAHCVRDHIPRLKKMLGCHMHKEVGHWAVLFKIGDEFNVKELLVPLYAQDRIQLIDDLLIASPTLLPPFLEFLDSLLTQSGNPKAVIEGILIEIGLVDMLGFIPPKVTMSKVIMKFIKRILDRHPAVKDIQIKNYQSRLVRKKIGFLMHVHQDNGFSGDTLNAMLEGLMEGQDDEVKEELIYKLVELNDLKSAIHWSETLNELSPQLQTLIDTIRLEECDKAEIVEDEVWDSFDQKYYHRISIPESSIIIIDTEMKFKEALKEVCLSDVVGIDCEWSPLMARADLSVLQLSIPNKVFVLDALSLRPYTHLWTSLIREVIANAAVIKIGFSLGGDIKILSEYLGFDVKGSCIFDLMVLRHLISTGHLSVPLPYSEEEDDKQRNSLSQMVFSCFGKHLKKTQQFSDWNNRPLTMSQLSYAALDAYVLIEIYEKLLDICMQYDIFFGNIIATVAEHFQNPAKKNKPKKKKKKRPSDICKEQADSTNTIVQKHDSIQTKNGIQPTVNAENPCLFTTNELKKIDFNSGLPGSCSMTADFPVPTKIGVCSSNPKTELPKKVVEEVKKEEVYEVPVSSSCVPGGYEDDDGCDFFDDY